MKSILIAGVLITLIGAPAALFFLSSPVGFEVTPAPRVFVAENTFCVNLSGPHGVRSLTARLEQGQTTVSSGIEEQANRFMFWRRKQAPPSSYQLKLPAGSAQGFRSGPAKLIVEASANDFRQATTTRSYDVVVNLAPLRLSVDSDQHYASQGGSEVLTFHVSGYWTEAGVRVGTTNFRSFPLPGAKNDGDRFCLFAVPWDAPDDVKVVVYASNPGGEEATVRPHVKIMSKHFRRRDLELSEEFLKKVTTELDPSGTGQLLDRFLQINGDMRRQNNATLAALKSESEAALLWNEPFQQLTNSKVEAFFADVRSYRYGGRKVDEQVHLGFDLSKVKEAPVVASNAGKVVYADRLGIYGQCVVIDHGYGLQSIYAHLSSIAAKKGQVVKRGDEIARSGATGMAGGDHLHFSMQVDGVQVNPIEWWDPKWLNEHVLSRLRPVVAEAAPGQAEAREAKADAPDHPRPKAYHVRKKKR